MLNCFVTMLLANHTQQIVVFTLPSAVWWGALSLCCDVMHLCVCLTQASGSKNGPF